VGSIPIRLRHLSNFIRRGPMPPKISPMPTKKRQFAVWCILPILAVVFLLYGAAFNFQPVYPKDKVWSSPESELTLIQEVTVGGVELDAIGQLRKTYTNKPLDFCPT